MRLSNIKIFDIFYKAYHAWPTIYSNVIQLISFGQWESWQSKVFEDIKKALVSFASVEKL